MTRRHQPRYRGGQRLSASKLNDTSGEVGRLTGVSTSGAIQQGEHVHDRTPGRHSILPLLEASGGAETIVFRPTGVAAGIGFTCDAVIAEVLTSSCTSLVQIGDEVTVWDIAPRFDLSPSGFFRMPHDLLFASYGFATWMKTHESEYDRPEGVGDCRWVVQNMLCVEPSSY